ncbi:hypothetical protein G9A89_021094 [Geosiphon pyriformis]|nr:hypothetical protein G9A89_021094 [Geosiphon pyriformis]
MFDNSWTRKQVAFISLPIHWSNQYVLLDYVSDSAFSNVMNVIGSDEFFLVVKKLPDRKATGISDGLSKPSLAKAHSDVKFFSNVVLRKAITEKQFLYLVSAVLQPIIGYKLSFSCVSKNVCEK